MDLNNLTGFYSQFNGLVKVKNKPLIPDPKSALYRAGKVTRPYYIDYGISNKNIDLISPTHSEYMYGSQSNLIGEDDIKFINATMINTSGEGEIDNGF